MCSGHHAVIAQQSNRTGKGGLTRSILSDESIDSALKFLRRILEVAAVHQGQILLLTGDIGVAQERKLAARGLPPADVVLAAHHGSASSSGSDRDGAVMAESIGGRLRVWAQRDVGQRYWHGR